MQRLLTLIKFTFTVRTSTAVVPLGGYGAMTQFEGVDASTIVFGALLLTIFMQLHRVWFVYTPVIDAASSERKLQTGQLIAYSFSAVIVLSVVLAMAHYHIMAELVIGIQQCLMISVLMSAWFGNLKIRGKLAHHLATEVMHVAVLVWLILVTVRGPWDDGKAVEFSLIVVVILASSHYVLHLMFTEHVKLPENKNTTT